MSDQVKPGEQTTEYKEAKSANVWSTVGLILGFVLTTGAAVVDSLGGDSKLAIIAGAVIAVAAIAEKTLVSLGYIKGRSEVKAAAEIKNVE